MATSVLAGELEDGKWKGKKLWFYKSLSGKVHWMFLHNLICLHTTDLKPIIVGIKRRSNSIPWCTLFHVILSLRTWHIMITTLHQHACNEHRSARCVWFSNMFRFSSLCFWEYNCIELADIHCALKKNFSVTLKGYICFTDLSRTTCALGRNYKHQVWGSATERFTRTETMTYLGSNKTAATLWR